MGQNSKLIDIAVEIRHETSLAWILFDGKQTVSVPKSLVENNNDGTFTMPEWLALEKELI